MDSLSGKLGTDCSFPELLRRAFAGRWSGELLVEEGERKKKIYLDRGLISYCATNINSERLGSVLLARGIIDAETLHRALKEKGSMRLGQKLVAEGVISEDDLQKSLVETARENVCDMFNWQTGLFTFGPVQTQLPDDLQFRLPASDVILEGVRLIEDFQVVEQGLAALQGALTIAENPPELSQTDSLTPTEGFLLSRIDGTLTLEEVCTLSTVERELTCRSLYGMYCAGMIRGDTADDEAEFIARVARTEPPPPVAHLEQEPEPPARPSRPRQVSRGGPVGAKQIDSKYAICCEAQVDYYTVLEVASDASEEQIRQAYYKLAKQYHPDRHRGKGGADMEQKLEGLFMKIGEAYDILHEANKRFEYDQAIQKNPAMADGKTILDHLTPEEQARTHFKEGMRFYLEKDFWNAVQLFRRAIEVSPDSNSEHYRYLALALSQNPKWGKEAERYFLKAIELEPFSPDLRLLLGRLYRQSGMTKRAEGQFQEALKLEPGNQAIQVELDGLADDAGEKGGSFIKGLFRKNPKDS